MTRKFGWAKSLVGAAICCMLCGPYIINAQEVQTPSKHISLYIHEKLVDTSLSNPVRIGGRVLVPAREVFETLGADVEYKELEKKVYMFFEGQLMILELNNPEVWLEGEIKTLDVPAQVINDKLMIPVRFVSEEFGFEVKWNENDQSVRIGKPEEERVEDDFLELFPGLNDELDKEESIPKEEETLPKEEVEVPKEEVEVPKEEVETPKEEIVVDEDKDQPKEDQSQEDNAPSIKFENVQYVNNNTYQSIKINLGQPISIPRIVVNDYYMNKKIEIVLDKLYDDVLDEGVFTIADEIINTMTVQHRDKTVIILDEKIIRSVSFKESASGIEIILKKPSDQYDKLIVLDAGHGGYDSGSIGIGNVYEKDLNFEFVKATMASMEQYAPGVKVYLTRDSDVFYSLQERADLANEIGADAFVSIHNNSAGPTAQGAEVLYNPTEDAENMSLKMAQLMQEKLVNVLGMKDRGVKPRPDLYVLRKTEMPAVLLEVGFLTNEGDLTKMKNPEFVKELGKQVAIFISEIFTLGNFS